MFPDTPEYITIPDHPPVVEEMKNWNIQGEPYTGDELGRCDASELNGFLSYFRGLIGVWDIPFEVVA